MIIQHNITALNAYNRLSNNNSVVSKNLEKLSSGYRINRAGDDAAGLAISEKMRAQITGLERAKLNAQDGISLVQTAEGALTEVHSMLNRLVELDTQSANGTYQTEDREKIQSEVNALLEEVDRISQATNFNGINLLDGSLATDAVQNLSTGNKVATVLGSIGSLKTGIQDQAAVAGKYEASIAGIKNATAPTAGSTVQFSITYIDTNGKEQTKNLSTAALAATDTSDKLIMDKIFAAVNADKDLNALFTASGGADKLVMTAKNGGTNGAQFKSISVIGATKSADGTSDPIFSGVKEFSASTTQVAADRTLRDIIEFDNGHTLAAGETITIGDKTYEFFAAGGDATSVAKGNVAVSVGNADADSMNNLVAALQANGVKSASVTTDAAGNASKGIKIGNLDEIKTAAKTANIKVNSNGIKLSEVDASAQVTEFKVTAGSGGTASFTMKYLDEQGKEKTISLSYASSTTSATANANAIKDEIEANETLNKLFTVQEDGNGKVTITSKGKGENAAQLKSVETNDVNRQSVNNFQVVQAARKPGQTLSIDAAQMSAGDTLSIGGKTFQFVTKDNMKVDGNNIAVLLDPRSNENTAANLNLAFEKAGVGIEYNAGTNSFFVPNDAKSTGSGGLILQIGDTNDDFNKVTVSVEDMSVKGLNLEGLIVTDQGLAGEGIDRVKAAIEKVSVNRGNLGALQNRLEHTINNLTVTTENMTAAESRIRDTDMAKEMMQFTKNNVLVQAAQAMLAQANQQPQQVLQLLR